MQAYVNAHENRAVCVERMAIPLYRLKPWEKPASAKPRQRSKIARKKSVEMFDFSCIAADIRLKSLEVMEFAAPSGETA
jgi:hypothetical protein